MILLTKINGQQMVLNCDLIEYIEETPDTVITLTNNDKVLVRDRMVEIIGMVVAYRRKVAGLVEADYARRLAEV
jgi:flagellar protein FlbD